MSADAEISKNAHVNLPASAGEKFDAEFYKQHYPDTGTLSTDELVLHWESVGLGESRLANDSAAVDHYSVTNDLPADFDVDEYLFLNADIRENFRWKYQAVLHYVEHGEKENRSYSISSKRKDNNSFEWLFYKAFNEDLGELNESELKDHWLKYGLDEGRYCSLEGYLEGEYPDYTLPDDFNIPSYINNNKDLVGAYSGHYEYLKHFLNCGIPEKRAYKSLAVDVGFLNTFYGSNLTSRDPVTALEAIRAELNLTATQPVFLSEAEMCNYYGFREEKILEIFDHDAYVHLNGDVTNHLEGCYRAECLNHFLETGWKKSCEISYYQKFDQDFYEAEYGREVSVVQAKLSALSNSNEKKQALYAHWLKQGINDGFFPNLSMYVKEEVGMYLPEEIRVAVENYSKLRNKNERSEKPIESFNQYADSGWELLPRTEPVSITSAGVLCGIGMKLRREGNRDKAIRLYETILESLPDYPVALHQLGDEYLKSGFLSRAISCYQKLIDSNTASQWTFVNCASCFEKKMDYCSAAMVLGIAKKTYPTDVLIGNREKEMVRRQFYETYEKASSLSLVGDVDNAKKLISASLSIFEDGGVAKPVYRTTGKVAIVANLDLPQCKFYRVDQKIELLESIGYRVSLFSHNESFETFYQELEEYEAVIFYRVPSFPDVVDAINATNIEGIPSIYEVDDLIFDENEFPPPYSTYAKQITEDQYNRLCVDVPLVSDAMRRCTHGIASTQYLADYMSSYVKTGEVSVLRNGLSSVHMSSVSKANTGARDDSVTIFYGSGTKAHKEEFHQILEPVFIRLKQKHGARVKFVLVGSYDRTGALKELGDSVVIADQIENISQFWDLMVQCADINLSILAPTAVTNSKSEIKWLEAGMFGIPSVVSTTSAYQECTSDGEDIFLCDTQDEFFEKIDLLVVDHERRKQIGESASKSVLSKYSVDKQAQIMKGILEGAKPAQPSPKDGTSRKIKIAAVNVFYPPEAIGGATRVVYDNISAMLANYKDRFEIEVFCSKSGKNAYEVSKYLQDDVKVTAVTCPPGRDQALSDSQMKMHFDNYLEKVDPDIVHFHCIQRLTESIVTATRARNIPYVITAHDGWWVSDKQFLTDSNDIIDTYQFGSENLKSLISGSSRRYTLQAEIEGANGVLAVSESFGEIYKNTGLDNVRVIENGLSRLTPAARNPSTDGKVRLAHIGGMQRHKGLFAIKNAMVTSKELSNLELLVVDHAATPGSYREEVWGSTTVKIIAKTSQSSIAELYSNIDVLMAPSIWPESYGLVTREAIHCGCWVVASDRGAVGACIEDGKNGHVVSVNDSSELKDILHTIDANPQRYMESPAFDANLRDSDDQVDDLVELYLNIYNS